MIAEIHHKISSDGSNLTNQMEDKLTSNVFGTLRYLPFEQGMLPILEKIQWKKIANNVPIKNMNWLNSEINFWEKHEKYGEPDIIIKSSDQKIILCIEIKYNSGLSNSNNIKEDNENEEKRFKIASGDQLLKYNELLKENYLAYNKNLILVARESFCANLLTEEYFEKFSGNNVNIGYISWQTILEEMLIASENNKEIIAKHTRNIYLDIIDLLKKKGFERFKSFRVNGDVEKDIKWSINQGGIPMSSDKGGNIAKAVEVLRQTYDNIFKLQELLIPIMKNDEDYGLAYENYLRWASDIESAAWVRSSFIFLFRQKKKNSLGVVQLSGPVYVLEFDLSSQDDMDVPKAIFAKYEYENMAKWPTINKRPVHYVFSEPHHEELGGNKSETDNIIKIEYSNSPSRCRYKYTLNKNDCPLFRVTYTKIPLMYINGENLLQKIKENFNSLKNLS